MDGFCKGKTAQGASYGLRDPREAEIARRIAAARDNPRALYERLSTLPGFMPERLAMHSDWSRAVKTRLATMLAVGMAGAIELEADNDAMA